MRLQALFRRENALQGEARLEELRYIVFDTEFTSLDQRTNRLLSIGAVVMEGPKIRVGEQFYCVVNPRVEVPGQSVVVHRLRAEDIEKAESPQAVLERFVEFSRGAVLVGHFVDYDVDIVKKELAGCGMAAENTTKIDTARVHRWLEMRKQHNPTEGFDERTIRTDLASVAAHYGITFEEAHHALADAYVTAQVRQREIAELAVKGVRTWKQLRPALR